MAVPYIFATATTSLPLSQLDDNFAYFANAISVSGTTVSLANLVYTGTLTGGTGVINIGSGQIYKDASGQLIVGGTTALATSANRGNITINGTSSSILTLGVGGAYKAYLYSSGTNLTLNNASTGYISFENNGGEKLRIDSSGNVGIGTSSPANILQITKSTAANTFLQSSNSLATSYYGVDGAGAAYCWNGSNYPVLFGTNGIERMRINSSGNVGIGTATPDQILTINGASLIKHQYTGAANGILIGQYNSTGDASINNQANALLNFATNNVERMRIPAAGGVQAVTTISVGNATPSSSGAGVTFPASQSASSDANTLDDYEEGTWTPVVASSSGTITSYTASGYYTKIGNTVVAAFTYNITNAGTGSALITVTAPFTSQNVAIHPTGSVAEVAVAGWGGYCIIAANSTSVQVQKYDGGYAGATGVVVRGTITYFTA